MNRVVTLLLFLVVMSASAQQSRSIIFREEIFDFGSIKEDGGPVVHEFQFTNGTNRPLKILNVQPSCGCTTPDWSKDPVGPGKTGFIQASYNPKGRPGYFNKTLSVTTDFESNAIVLQIKGNVTNQPGGSDNEFLVAKGNWKLKSGSLNMGKVYLNEDKTVRDFPFLNSGSKAITVTQVIAPAYIMVEVTPKTIPGGTRGHIKVTYNGQLKNQYGFHTDNIEIHTDDITAPVKSFSVYATLEDDFSKLTPEDRAKAPRLQLAASSIDFGRVTNNSSIEREISFTNTGKRELQIKAVQGNCTCLKAVATKATLKPGESGAIKVTFDAQERKATQQKSVTIYSNDPQSPVQRFTFTAFVAE